VAPLGSADTLCDIRAVTASGENLAYLGRCGPPGRLH
jgi:hypothetical protein